MRSHSLVLVVAALAAGCVSFAAIRTAEVTPGASSAVQVSLTTAVGDEAGWFYQLECPSQCSRSVASLDFTAIMGFTSQGIPKSVGVGLNGTAPYLELYGQVSQRRFPVGLGARLGIPASGWSMHGLFARADIPLGPAARILIDPTLFAYIGNSPNGANPGSHVGFAQGLGVELGQGSWRFIPGVTAVIGQAGHSSSGEPRQEERRGFLMFSLGIERKRSP